MADNEDAIGNNPKNLLGPALPRRVKVAIALQKAAILGVIMVLLTK